VPVRAKRPESGLAVPAARRTERSDLGRGRHRAQPPARGQAAGRIERADLVV